MAKEDMPEESGGRFVLTWGFLGGKRFKPAAAAAPAPAAEPATAQARPGKAAAGAAAASAVVPAGPRRAVLKMLPGLSTSVPQLRAPGLNALATDGLAARYSAAGASGGNARAQEAAMLFAIAEGCIAEDDDHARALQAAQTALSIFQEQGDEHAEADALRLLVHAQRFKAEAQRAAGDELGVVKTERTAMAFAVRMASSFRAAGKQRSLAAMLLSMAEVGLEKRSGTHESRRADQEEALTRAKEAQALAREVKDKRLEATALLVMCLLYMRHNAQVARKAAAASQGLFKTIGDSSGNAKAQHLLAHACFRDGAAQEGLKAAREALSLRKELEDDVAAAQALMTIAQRQLANRRPTDALPAAEEALSLLREAEAEKGWQAAAEALAVEAQVMGGEVRPALARAEACLARHTEEDSAMDKAVALDTLARVHLAAGDKEKALSTAEEGLTLCRELGGSRALEAGFLHLVGKVQAEREDFAQAAVMAGGAARLFRRLGDDLSEASAMLTEAEADLASGDFYDASETAREALLVAQDLGDKATEAAALLAEATAHLAREEADEALVTAKQAQALFSEDADGKAGEAKALRLVAQVQMLSGNYEQAADPGRKALAALRELGDAKAEVEMLRVLAGLHVGRKRHEEAVRAAYDAFSLGKQLGWSTREEAEAHLLLCQTNFSRMCHDADTARDAWGVVSRSEAKVLKSADEALQLARKEGDKALLAYALFTQASVSKYLHISLGKLEKLNATLQACAEAAKLFQELGDAAGEGNASLVAAEVHMACGRPQQAQEEANKAAAMGMTAGDQDLTARAEQLFRRPAPMQPQQQQQVAVVPQALPEAPAPQVVDTGTDSLAQASKEKGLDPAYVKSLVQQIALEAVGDTEAIDMDTALMESGLDSLGAITFRNRLQQETGLKLAGTLMFDYPTMAGVADHIVEMSRA